MVAHCAPGAVDFIARYFDDCVYTTRDVVGFALGMSSIACWFVAQVPQLIENWRTQRADALSVWFLTQWLVGDTCNLLGCLLKGDQVRTAILQAEYFVCADAVLLVQYIYYSSLQKRRERAYHLAAVRRRRRRLRRRLQQIRQEEAALDAARGGGAGGAQPRNALDAPEGAAPGARGGARADGPSKAAALGRDPSPQGAALDVPLDAVESLRTLDTTPDSSLPSSLGSSFPASLISSAATTPRARPPRPAAASAAGAGAGTSAGAGTTAAGATDGQGSSGAAPVGGTAQGTARPSRLGAEARGAAVADGTAAAAAAAAAAPSDDLSAPLLGPSSGSGEAESESEGRRDDGPGAGISGAAGASSASPSSASAASSRASARRRRSVLGLAFGTGAGLGAFGLTSAAAGRAPAGATLGAVARGDAHSGMRLAAASGLGALSPSPLATPSLSTAPSLPFPLLFMLSSAVPPWQAALSASLGYVSGVLYLCSRVSQIAKNRSRRSAEGLAPAMFTVAVLANTTFGSSLIVRATSASELVTQIPWIIGSLGTVLLDAIILAQCAIYGRVTEDDVLAEAGFVGGTRELVVSESSLLRDPEDTPSVDADGRPTDQDADADAPGGQAQDGPDDVRAVVATAVDVGARQRGRGGGA